MTRVSEITGNWFGLCRKPPAVPALQLNADSLRIPACEGQPDRGGGGSGTIFRGIGAALSGLRTLNRNRQLLWFTLLAGLALAGNAAGHAALYYINRFLEPTHFPAGEGPASIFGVPVYDTASYSLEFLLAFATLFCLVFLLAGLVLSISSRKNAPASFSEGMRRAKKILKPLMIWSLALASAGFLLDRMYVYLITAFPYELGFLYTLGDGFFVSMVDQFPFNWTLDWNMLTEIPGYGGRSLLSLIYPFGFLETLHFSGIVLFLFVLTPFVVPLMVLEHRTLRDAVTGSFVLMKKVWAESAACALFLGVLVSGIFLMYLFVQAASGIVSPYETVTFHPPGTWVALALLYDLALVTVAFIIATVGGIAALDICASERGRLMIGLLESQK